METDADPWSQGRLLLLQRSKLRALACLNEHQYQRAFAHFIVVLTVQPSLKGELLNAFLFTLEQLTDKLEADKNVNEILSLYQQALDVLPCDSHVLHGLASTLYRLGFVESAASYFLKSYQANPFFTPSLYCMENLKNALVERWHFVMLNDQTRNIAYQRAIQKAVGAGYKTVLDIGAGTGIFSMAALDAGADKVFACEGSEIMSAVLQSVCENNKKSIQVISKFSSEISIPEDMPEKVSLVVTEIFDAGLFGENSLETLDHAWENLLLRGTDCDAPNCGRTESCPYSSFCNDVDMNTKPGNNSSNSVPLGRVIPHAATAYAVPVESRQFRRAFRLDESISKAMGFKKVTPRCLDDEPYTTDKLNKIPSGYKMLSDPAVLLETNFNSLQEVKSLLQGKIFSIKFNCSQDGLLDAVVVWFELHLDEEISISTGPNSSSSSCWDQAVFYALPQNFLGSPACKIGECIQTEFLCQGHLCLQKIQISNSSEACSSENSLETVLDTSLISTLNSYSSGNIINLDFKSLSDVANLNILDISAFPVLSLKAIKDNSSVLTCLRNQYEEEVEQFHNLHHLPNECLNFISYEELYKTQTLYDCLVMDPVEQCGLLKKNILEDVMMLRNRCLKESGFVIPGYLEISAILIESPELVSQSKVISDDRTLNYNIAKILNAYQCRIHQDIHFTTLSHRQLSRPFSLTTIDFNTKSDKDKKSLLINSPQTCETEIIEEGNIHAIIYWFILKYSNNCVLNTVDPDGLWKQAACIVEGDVSVRKGDKIQLDWSLKGSCLQIGFYNANSSVLS